MDVALTNCGHKYIIEYLKRKEVNRIDKDLDLDLLLKLNSDITVSYQDNLVHNTLLDKGFIKLIPSATSKENIILGYRRNPLEHVDRVIFEYTSLCDFSCRHCYNAKVKQTTEKDLGVLKKAVDLFVTIGIRRFEFIGGEVSKYGTNWLELAKHIKSYGENILLLYTNGWWVGQKNFWAAWKYYSNDFEYLSDLKEHGVTHILFSLDGPEEIHDYSRNKKGLYRKILDGIDLVKAADMIPRVSVLVQFYHDLKKFLMFLAEIADKIYNFPQDTSIEKKVLTLEVDTTNTFSNFIDIGNGAGLGVKRFSYKDVKNSKLYCKGYFRPFQLTIKANGELSTCRITNAGEGYGNLHDQNLIDILNHLQDSFIFKLHAQKRLSDYIKFIDPAIFGDTFAHMCTLRAILTMIAKKIEEQDIELKDKESIQCINREVAQFTGHL